MKLKGENTVTAKELKSLVKQIEAKEVSKGAAIRTMFAGGMSVKEISAATNIRYNHVYNVVKNEVLVKGLGDELEATKGNENSKKAQVIKLLEEGKTITEVSRELKVLYNYAWQIAKAAGYTKKQTDEAAVEVKEA